MPFACENNYFSNCIIGTKRKKIMTLFCILHNARRGLQPLPARSVYERGTLCLPTRHASFIFEARFDDRKNTAFFSKSTTFLTIITAPSQNIILQVSDNYCNTKIAKNGINRHLGRPDAIFRMTDAKNRKES